MHRLFILKEIRNYGVNGVVLDKLSTVSLMYLLTAIHLIIEMELTLTDKESETWRKLKAHFNELIEQSHKDLEKEIPEIRTAQLRGRIKVLRLLVKLDQDQAPQGTPEV